MSLTKMGNFIAKVRGSRDFLETCFPKKGIRRGCCVHAQRLACVCQEWGCSARAGLGLSGEGAQLPKGWV
jgi:hypothetical protein